jgi:hypothetical protein
MAFFRIFSKKVFIVPSFFSVFWNKNKLTESKQDSIKIPCVFHPVSQ